MRVFNTLIPYSNEAILSFFNRLALVNGFMNLDDFYKMCVSVSGKSLYSSYGKSFSGDPSGINERLSFIRENLPAGHPLHDDPETFYLNHSLFSLYSMFFKSTEQRAQFLQYVCFGNGLISPVVNRFIKRPERPICFCEDCYQQDIEQYGIPLIHREHQIVGVCICTKHYKPLRYATSPNWPDSFDGMKIINGYKHADHSQAIEYAIMCNDLLNTPIITNLDIIEETISNTMKCLPPLFWSYYSEDELKQHPTLIEQDTERRIYLVHAALDTGLIDGIDGYVKKKRYLHTRDDVITDSYISNYYGSAINIGLVMLFILYKTADFVKTMISKRGIPSKEDMARIVVNLLTNDYSIEDIESEPYNTYLLLTHKTCGNTTRFTIRKFMNGDRCPHCNSISSFKDYIEHTTGAIVNDNTCNKFTYNKNQFYRLNDKELLQELNRPYLSPILLATKEERILAFAYYRAKALIDSDCESVLPEMDGVDVKEVYKRLENIYPNENHATVNALCDYYKHRLSGNKFSALSMRRSNEQKNQSAS